jgi:hypothetical protein
MLQKRAQAPKCGGNGEKIVPFIVHENIGSQITLRARTEGVESNRFLRSRLEYRIRLASNYRLSFSIPQRMDRHEY